MARLTVEEIMTQIAATVNQEATAPTAGGSEHSLWLQYINRGYQEWAEAYDWEETRKRLFPTVSGGATVSLPDDFDKLADAPTLYGDNDSEGVEFPEALPEKKDMYASNDKYIEVIGNYSDGFSLLFHPATLASGASLLISYFSTPTSLATDTQVPLTSDPQYLVDRTIAYIFEARSDARFQIEENKARERLLTMIENANAAKYNSYASPDTLVTPERKMSFRIGRD